MTRLFPHDEVGMVAPPPLIYAAPLLAGWLVDWRWPLRIGGPDSITTRGWIANGLIAAGLAIALPAVGWFIRRRTPVIPFTPMTTIVRSGPYRFTRNPMYVGLTLVTLGLGLMMNTWCPVMFVPIAVAVIDRGVIAREEQYMRSKFGAEYDEFTHRVRRWI